MLFPLFKSSHCDLCSVHPRPDQSPFSFRLFPVHDEMKSPGLPRFRRFLAKNMIVATVPNHHRAAAILSFRNDALKRRVFYGVVLHLNSEMFFPFFPRQPFRDRPGL